MKKLLLNLMILSLITNNYLVAKQKKYNTKIIKGTYNCPIIWQVYKGKRYKPNPAFNYLDITFLEKMDILHIKSANGESFYTYDSFIDLDNGNKGITYYNKNNGYIIDIFNNGDMMLFINNTPITKAQCKNLPLNVLEVHN